MGISVLAGAVRHGRLLDQPVSEPAARTLHAVHRQPGLADAVGQTGVPDELDGYAALGQRHVPLLRITDRRTEIVLAMMMAESSWLIQLVHRSPGAVFNRRVAR
jgi:hypothetical protein